MDEGVARQTQTGPFELPATPARSNRYLQSSHAQEKARRPSLVDPELLDGTSIDFRRSLVRPAYILQHAVTLHPMAGDLQVTLNSETSGISNIHSWGLMLPSSSRVSPVTYHAVVAVRYPSLCRIVNGG